MMVLIFDPQWQRNKAVLDVDFFGSFLRAVLDLLFGPFFFAGLAKDVTARVYHVPMLHFKL